MSDTPAIRLEAEMDERERPAMVAAAQQLSEALHAASGQEWPIQLKFWESRGGVVDAAEGATVILSLLPEVDRDEPVAEVEARWRSKLEALSTKGAALFVVTAFRAVPERWSPAGQQRLERIRRLNRLAPELSHDFAAGVMDVDQSLAHIGARVLQTDYSLKGRVAAEVAGHTIALLLLSMGVDAWVPIEIQEQALAFHRPLNEIDAVVRRRLARA